MKRLLYGYVVLGILVAFFPVQYLSTGANVLAIEMSGGSNMTSGGSNMTSGGSNMTSGGSNMTSGGSNMTMTGIPAAKMKLEEGMKAFKNENFTEAITHFNAAVDSLANSPSSVDAVRLMREGIKLIESGDRGLASSILENASKLLG